MLWLPGKNKNSDKIVADKKFNLKIIVFTNMNGCTSFLPFKIYFIKHSLFINNQYSVKN